MPKEVRRWGAYGRWGESVSPLGSQRWLLGSGSPADRPWWPVTGGWNLIVIGLVAAGVFALLLDVIEPPGWLRLIAVPPALLLAAMWRDITTIIYSVPTSLVLFVVLTLLVALPPLIGLARGGPSQPA